jgi:hypothetical protein
MMNLYTRAVGWLFYALTSPWAIVIVFGVLVLVFGLVRVIVGRGGPANERRESDTSETGEHHHE